MVRRLSIAGGIQAIPMRDIPSKWDSQWFSEFINTQLRFADVRNMTFGSDVALTQSATNSNPPTVTSSTHIKIQVNGVSRTQLSKGAALSVLGNPTNATANEVDIASSSQGDVLWNTSGTALAFAPLTRLGTVTNGTWQASAIATIYGGTGQVTYNVGDLLYGTIGNALNKLPGNTTTTKQFLTQTGTGSASAAPAWGVIASTDLPGNFSGFANPSANVGLSAVNGAATTAMRSDAAPAIDQTITPTWTNQHIFAPIAGTHAIVINGAAAGVGVPVVKINTQALTGTTTATLSATNKPGTNNQTTPATWLPINLDGTTYYLPAFAA